jgi:hypothetical protein
MYKKLKKKLNKNLSEIRSTSMNEMSIFTEIEILDLKNITKISLDGLKVRCGQAEQIIN